MTIKRSSIAFVIILLLSWCTYQGYENAWFFRIPLHIKHLINFILLVSVFGVGLFGFSRQQHKWVIPVWLICYPVVIILMAVVGVLDLYYKINVASLRDMIYHLRMFFSSPVPFGILFLLSTKLKSKTTVNHEINDTVA